MLRATFSRSTSVTVYLTDLHLSSLTEASRHASMSLFAEPFPRLLIGLKEPPKKSTPVRGKVSCNVSESVRSPTNPARLRLGHTFARRTGALSIVTEF
jgi:hypothetical protein